MSMSIPTNILKSEFEKLVQLEIEKINISESIKIIKQTLKDEKMQTQEIAALSKIATAKAKEALDDLSASSKKIEELLGIVA